MAEETEVVKKIRKPPRIPRLKQWMNLDIEWHDAVTSYEAHHSDSEILKPAIRVTTGKFIKRENGCLVVSMEDDRRANLDGVNCQTVTAIPIISILHVWELVRKE